MATESPLPPSAVVNVDEKNGNGEAATLTEEVKPVSGVGDGGLVVEDDFEMGPTKAGLEAGQTVGPTKDGQSAFAADIPPDGGYGWVMVGASFLIQAFTLGLQTSYGPFQRYYLQNNTFETTSNVQIAFVSSICTALTFAFGPLAGTFCERFGFRAVSLSGSCFVLVGMIISSFATQLWHLYLSYGVIVGIGAALSYIPAVGIVPMYFRKKLVGLENGRHRQQSLTLFLTIGACRGH
jgi:hypothetical protein